MAADLLPYAVLVGLLLLGVSIYLLASCSREAELKQALPNCEIRKSNGKMTPSPKLDRR